MDLSPAHIIQLGVGFWGPKTLLSAVELGVFTELATGALTAESLRARLRLHPRSAHDFFDALVALGMLERQDGLYSNTPETDHFLDRAKPTYIGDYLDMINARLYGFWGALTGALRSGEPQDDARRQHAPGLLMSLNMLIETTGGFDFTGADCCGWMREVGFRETYLEHLDGPASMAVGIKN
jgi:hypothetical protein